MSIRTSGRRELGWRNEFERLPRHDTTYYVTPLRKCIIKSSQPPYNYNSTSYEVPFDQYTSYLDGVYVNTGSSFYGDSGGSEDVRAQRSNRQAYRKYSSKAENPYVAYSGKVEPVAPPYAQNENYQYKKPKQDCSYPGSTTQQQDGMNVSAEGMNDSREPHGHQRNVGDRIYTGGESRPVSDGLVDRAKGWETEDDDDGEWEAYQPRRENTPGQFTAGRSSRAGGYGTASTSNKVGRSRIGTNAYYGSTSQPQQGYTAEDSTKGGCRSEMTSNNVEWSNIGTTAYYHSDHHQQQFDPNAIESMMGRLAITPTEAPQPVSEKTKGKQVKKASRKTTTTKVLRMGTSGGQAREKDKKKAVTGAVQKVNATAYRA